MIFFKNLNSLHIPFNLIYKLKMLSISQNPLISFLVFLSILSSQTIKAIDIYVSSAASLPGDGSQALPYSSLVSALNATYIDSSVRILLLNNQNSYIIDSELNITYNLQIAYNNGGINAILDFSNKGSINLNGLFSMVLINIQIQQTSANYQPTVSALNLVNSLGLNMTVKKYFFYFNRKFIFNFFFRIPLSPESKET